jgi:outer membrane protein
MKKLNVLIAVVGLLIAGNATAQAPKIAYVRIDDIVSVMPELDPSKVSMDTVGQKYVQDSIMPGLDYKQTQYNEKVKIYSDTTKKLSPQVKGLMLQEIQDLQATLSNAEAYIQSELQKKQQEFLRPYYAKAKKAIEQVAKEKGYTHVMNTDVFLVAPEADDISLAVVAKLGIKLPNQNPPANNKPAPKTN